jgi:pyroglutamyl-peptidase
MSLHAVLVTAFEPFGGETVNASWEAARRIDGWRCGEAVVTARKLSCAYGICVSEFVETFERLRPSIVLMTGQAASRGMICVERVARLETSATARDNRGALGCAALAGPVRLQTAAPAYAVARAIRETCAPVRVSADAGDYVCNHLYYGALHYLAGASPTTAAIFIHLPATPEQSSARASVRRLATTEAIRALQAGILALSRQTGVI